ncbi:uncharacterized protein LOC116275889 isoform X6 [Papio anubis]|uniref:uncharacterized protein LOC116275889 isoform X6 n=1 Tax=Papio anubis TaxID=9555 RepID=UPI0012AD84A8|nr:uncharacterized protein LOC116275889 isoform X6 [Papio anubis]
MAGARAGGWLRGGGVRERAKPGVSGPGEGKRPVVSCSHPEPSATILGETRISRPRRKTGGLAGRAEYPGRQRAPPGRARAPGRDAGTWGGAKTRGRAPRSAPPSLAGSASPPACRRRRRTGRWEEEVARGPSESHQGRSPSCDWTERVCFSQKNNFVSTK